MRIECGIVTDVKNDSVLVESAPETGCASCAARGSCMVGSEVKQRSIWMKNSIGAVKGDIVSFKIEERGVVIASLLLYLLPVLMLIAGALTGTELNKFFDLEKDLAAGIGGILGLVLSFILIRIFSFFTRSSDIFSPVLLEKSDEDHQ